MTPNELDALIERGIDALKAAKGLSGEEQSIVNKAIAKLEAADVPAEEPEQPAKDSEQEPKAAKGRRIIPRGSTGKKGK